MTPVDHRSQTTLITGASSGIGREFARALAARGSSLVLVARRRDRLEELAASLAVPVTVLPLDLTEAGAGARLAAATERLGVRVTSVVNNAGFGTQGPFHTEDPAVQRDMIAVNIAALTDISRAFVAPLRAAGTGFLVNVASLASYQPGPNMAVYAATKAYVRSFTEALWQESRGTGLRVLSLAPGLTRTEFFDVVGNDSLLRGSTGTGVQTPRQVVDYGLRVLDRRDPPPSAQSGLINRATGLLTRYLPRRVTLAALARSAALPTG